MARKVVKEVTEASTKSVEASTITSILDEIRKKNKNSRIELLSDNLTNFDIETFDSGNIVLNYLFACGGIPRGRVIEILGAASSGKSCMAQCMVAAIQKQGKVAVWLDVEHAFEPTHAARLGIDVSKVLITKPESAEEVFREINSLLNIEDIGLIVIDSVASMCPEEERDESKKYARLAAVMSKELRRVVSFSTKLSPPIIFLNQIRDNMNAMPFSDPYKTTGGKALEFYSSVRFQTSQKKKIKKEQGSKEVIGVETLIRCKKNKCGMPFREAVISVDYRKGVSRYSGLFDLLVNFGIIIKTGKTCKFDSKEFSREDFVPFFKENEKIILAKLEE